MMEHIWEKLTEHDKRFDRIEGKLNRIESGLSGAKYWFVGTTAALVLAGLGLTLG